MNFNIWEDFQICISIPLMFLSCFENFGKIPGIALQWSFCLENCGPINYKLQLFVFLKFWKIPAIKITLELLSNQNSYFRTAYQNSYFRTAYLEALLQNSCPKQLSGKLPGRSASALKKTPHGYATGKFPKFLLRFVSGTNFITPTRLKLVKK